VLQQQNLDYPLRRITQEDNDIKASKNVNMTKDDRSGRMAKKPRNA
jgi:cyclin-dependent kinase 8/11